MPRPDGKDIVSWGTEGAKGRHDGAVQDTEGRRIAMELTGRHAGGYRGFTWVSKAHYADSALKGMAYEDVFNLGVYHEDGGTSGEFTISWYRLRGELAAQLEIFEDAFEVAIHVCSDLMSALAELDHKNPQPQDVYDLLIKLGFRDRTPLRSKYEYREGDA